jgi:hypothetical protein
MMKNACLLFLICFFCTHIACAQEGAYQLTIRKTPLPITLDGHLNEPCWQTNSTAEHFKLVFPNDTTFSPWPTAVQLTFDDKNLYIGAICRQKKADYTVQSLRRDFGPGTTDVLNVMLDPTKDGLNGFLFAVSPFNVQREGLISNGDAMSLEWDNKWFSAVQNFEDYWTVEMAIPFKTLRYNVSEGQNSWGLQFIRTKVKNFETSVWRPVAFQYRPTNVAFCGTMIWETPPPKPGRNISLIPYVIGGASIDYLRNDTSLARIGSTTDWTQNIGGDAKIALTPGLNLDLTLNPDFSQVEVDRQVANLSRFELFFPETRQFFLENRDLFALFGFPNTRPFFSRRIGLAYNPVRERNEKVSIIGGARLSGKLTDGLRVGLLNMQTRRRDWSRDTVLPAANFTVATLQQKVFSRSTISGVFVNKQNFLGELNEQQKNNWQPWNRVGGLEYNLYSKDNRWEGEAYYHRSFSPDPKRRGGTLATFLGYRDRYFNAFAGYNRIDSTYRAEAGFVPRPGVQGVFTGTGGRFYPKRGWGARNIANYEINLNTDLTFGLNGQQTDRESSISSGVLLTEQSGMFLTLFQSYTYLFEPFDPTQSDYEKALPIGGYTYGGWRAEFFTGTSYDLQGEVTLSGGQYFNGNIFSVNGRAAYRLQPIGLFSILCSFNRIRLPAPYASADVWVVGPRVELAFTQNLFFSSFFQYNTQANNFNINARLQWRFAPVSDVFLVYTDNSYAEEIRNTPVRFFAPKNKALVLKAVYWLNV